MTGPSSPASSNVGKLGLLLLLAAAIASFFIFDFGQYLTLDTLKVRQAELAGLVAAKPVLVVGTFFLFYIAITAASLPGAAVLTLAAGAIFGLWRGVAIVSFASAIGATLAFLSARFLLRDWVQRRFGGRLRAINEGVERDGAFYLLSLRLVPVAPFFLVNLAMGLTPIRTITFYWVSQLGMVAGTVAFVNAGTQLARIDSPGDVLSPVLIGSFVLLGLFPLLAKAGLAWFKRRKLYARFTRPKHFDRNLVVIGAGAGGLVASYVAATVKAKVTLVEAREMGGDCLNTGCVPSKALIRAARAAHEMRDAGRFGIAPREPEVDFPAVMRRVRATIDAIAPHDSIERFTELGVDVRRGYATIVDPWTVEIARPDGGKSRLTTRAIVIAAGGEPVAPKLPGIEASGYLTSETMWDALSERDSLPERLAILGGGPIGCEMAQAFARLGSQVTLVNKGDRLLDKEDPEVSQLAAETLEGAGVTLLCGYEGVRCDDGALVVRGPEGAERSIPYDELIVALGRGPRLTGYGLEALGIDTSKSLVTNPYLETTYPNILAAGDVSGSYQFTHFASHQAWFAAVNGLFGQFRRFRADRPVLPWVTYLDPEIARVGHNETSATAAGIAHEMVRYDLAELDRAITEGATAGFVKVLVEPGKDRILGATIVGAGAGELIAELVLAMKGKLGLDAILGTIHAYPTLMEANRYAAGERKKAHKPERLLAWIERYHGWRRCGEAAPATPARGAMAEAVA